MTAHALEGAAPERTPEGAWRRAHGREPLLTVAVVAGLQRQRLQRVIDALAAQTIAAEIEIIVVDLRPGAGSLKVPAVPTTTVLARDAMSFGEARAEAVHHARSEVVAFIEDHCYPHAEWAQALMVAHREQWASVGYRVTNANPGSRSSRIVHLATYGEWEMPRRGPADSLPGNNVSYRRSALLDLGSDLAELLKADFNLHAELRRRGLPLGMEPSAHVEHESEESLSHAFRSTLSYSRVLAANRAGLEEWTRTRRLVWAIGILGGAPLARLARLLKGQRWRPVRSVRVAAYLPAIIAIYVVSAVGETLGYLVGEGRASTALMYWELDAPRASSHE